MSESVNYYVVPFEYVPRDPECTVWYATWSTQPPSIDAGNPTPWVICATANAELARAIHGQHIGTVRKNPPVPPPLNISPQYLATERCDVGLPEGIHGVAQPARCMNTYTATTRKPHCH